jgi:outer membrane murein-binding lipoprotein Lpp
MDRFGRLNRAEQVVVRMMPLIVAVIAVVVVGLAMMVQTTNRQVHELQGSVANLEAFVDELQSDPEGAAAQDEAIRRAVAIVPELRDILCEVHPDTEPCQDDG